MESLRHEGRERRVVYGALVAVALLALFRYDARDLTYFDEPRYAGVARTMAESGDWVLPRLYGEPYTEKPPLWFWCAAAAARLLGEGTTAWFLPNVLAHLLTALLLFDLGRRFEGRLAGALAALAYASCPLALHFARSAQIDPLLVFCETGAAWGFLLALERRRAGYGYLGALFLAAGVLVKGHVALFALLAPLSWSFQRRDFAWFKRPLPLLAGAALVAAPFLLWFRAVAARLGGREAVDLYLRRQILERTAGKVAHFAPWPVGAEYLGALAAMLPALLFVPAAWRCRSFWRRVCLLWAGSFFLVFALLPVKREIYLLPLAAPIAAIAGGEAARLFHAARGLTRLERAGGMFLSALCLLGALALAAVPWTFGVSAWWALAGPLVAAPLAGRAFVAFRRRGAPAAAMLFFAFAALAFLAEPTIGAVARARFTERPFGEAIRASVPADETVVILGFTKAHQVAYFGRRSLRFVEEVEDLAAALEPGESVFVVTKGKDSQRLERSDDLEVRLLAREARSEERKAKKLYVVRRLSRTRGDDPN